MFTRKSSRSGTDEEGARPGLLNRVGSTKTLTEVRNASSSSGTLERRAPFSVKSLYLYRSRATEGQGKEEGYREEKETSWRREEAHPQEAFSNARRRANSTSGRRGANRRLDLILACILLIGLAGCQGGEKRQSTWDDLYSSGRTLLERGDKDSLVAAQNKAEQGFRESAARDPVWNWKFRILKAEVLLWRGKST